MEAGFLPIDNNPAEHAIKPFVIDARLGCSATRPKALLPVRRFTAWPRPPRSTAKSPIRGCATYWNDCRMRSRWPTTKRYCNGTARQRCHSKHGALLAVDVLHGSLTVKLHDIDEGKSSFPKLLS